MLDFYEKKGRKIYVVVMISFILMMTISYFGKRYDDMQKELHLLRSGQPMQFVENVMEKKYRGQLEYVEGSVEIRKNLNAGWFSVDQNHIVDNGNELRTLANSRAIVTFEDGSSMRLSENSHISFSNDNGDILTEMRQGSIYSIVKKMNNRLYQVKTSQYLVTALGTEFQVTEGDEGVDVMVVESAVDIAHKDGEKIAKVEEGSKAFVKEKKVEKKEIKESDLEDDFVKWNRKKEKGNKKNKEKNKEDNKEKEKDIEKKDGKITLSGKKSSSGVRLHWDVSGLSVKHGFKVVKSREKNPVYPGDSAQYLSDPNTRDFKWKIDTGKKYYFRICTYNGNGGCSHYSNNVHIDTPSGHKDKGDDDGYATRVTLSADEDDDDVKLKWDISGGKAPKGFKIVKSKQKNPAYPGDDYKYISDKDERKYKWKGFKKDKTYYFRVCVYKGGKCGTYSNNVKVEF